MIREFIFALIHFKIIYLGKITRSLLFGIGDRRFKEQKVNKTLHCQSLENSFLIVLLKMKIKKVEKNSENKFASDEKKEKSFFFFFVFVVVVVVVVVVVAVVVVVDRNSAEKNRRRNLLEVAAQRNN